MKFAKKLVAMFLALVMALSLTTIAMADGNGKPIATKAPATAPTTISSVTIGGTAAEFQVDGYGTDANPNPDPDHANYDESQVFIRATLPTTTLENSLKSQSVVITMEDETTITGGTLLSAGTGYNYDDADYIYTITGVDLLNKSYTIVVDGKTYILAAGIDDNDQAQVAIPSTDPLAVSNVKFNGATTAANVYRVTVQNPCMGNPYFEGNTNTAENGWTFCNYYISATNVPAASNTAAVSTTLTKNAAATLGGNVSNVSGTTDVTATMNLSVTTPALTVTANGNTRTYVMMVTFASDGKISVTFGFDFSELKGTEWYTVKTKADEIAAAAAAYFGGTSAQPWGTIRVDPNTSAMTVLQQFMQSAGYPEYDPTSTYVASINGLAAFDTTGADGWMYTDSADGWSTSCNIPMVGGADYVLTEGARITWFYTTNYGIYWH